MYYGNDTIAFTYLKKSGPCFFKCVVPENIQTPTTEGIGDWKLHGGGGGGGVRGPGNSREE